MELKPGTRLRSPVCTAEFVVVRAPADDVDLRCGGRPVTDAAAPVDSEATPAPGFDGGSLIGKRYVDAAETVELLCTKAGPSSLSIGDAVLDVKASKPLPASD